MSVETIIVLVLVGLYLGWWSLTLADRPVASFLAFVIAPGLLGWIAAVVLIFVLNAEDDVSTATLLSGGLTTLGMALGWGAWRLVTWRRT